EHQPPPRPAGSRLVFEARACTPATKHTGARASDSPQHGAMENRAPALALSDLRPRLDENAPCPSAKTPAHLQASCGATHPTGTLRLAGAGEQQGSLRPQRANEKRAAAAPRKPCSKTSSSSPPCPG